MGHLFTRLEFIRLGAAGAAVWRADSASTQTGAAAAGDGVGVKKRIPTGLQLYSVRTECKADLPAVLKAVAAMGYEGVEFAGYHGRDAAELRRLLDENGLRCCGTHLGMEALTGDELKRTVELNQNLGNAFPRARLNSTVLLSSSPVSASIPRWVPQHLRPLSSRSLLSSAALRAW